MDRTASAVDNASSHLVPFVPALRGVVTSTGLAEPEKNRNTGMLASPALTLLSRRTRSPCPSNFNASHTQHGGDIGSYGFRTRLERTFKKMNARSQYIQIGVECAG